MTVEVFDVKDKKLITVTDAAAGHLQSQLNSLGKEALRLSVKESGCTGYMYVLEEVSAGEVEDVPWLDNGMQVFVDAGSVSFSAVPSWILSRKGQNRVLRFNNPNVSVACGCGESFDIEAQA